MSVWLVAAGVVAAAVVALAAHTANIENATPTDD